MSRLFTVAPLLVGLALLSSPAAAGCREDPRNASLGEEVARLKTYNCGAGGASEASGVKVEFYQFTNEVAATLVSGRPMASMAQILGRPELVKNSVFLKFKYIVDTFGLTQTYNLGEEGEKPNTEVNGQAFEGIDKGKVTLITLKSLSDFNSYPVSEIVELNKQKIPDNINVYYVCTSGLNSDGSQCSNPEDRSAVFWRYATLADIANYGSNVNLLSEAARANKGRALWPERGSEAIYDKTFGLLRYLGGAAGWPRTFLILSGAYSGAGCGTSPDHSWDFTLNVPMITLDAAIIRNDTGRPLRVDSVLGEEIADGPLRVADDATPAHVQPTSLNMPIQPGHSLLVPTRIALKSTFEVGQEARMGSAGTFQRLRAKGITARANVFAVPEWNNYVFGPELKVAGLVVDGSAIKFGGKIAKFHGYCVSR